MLKNTARFILILLLAVALGLLIYHLLQPAGTTSLPAGTEVFAGAARGFEGDHGSREGSGGLAQGIAGVGGNLLLIGAVTAIIVSAQRLFRSQARSVSKA